MPEGFDVAEDLLLSLAAGEPKYNCAHFGVSIASLRQKEFQLPHSLVRKCGKVWKRIQLMKVQFPDNQCLATQLPLVLVRNWGK